MPTFPYLNEAAAIVAELDALNARTAELARRVAAELPEDIVVQMSIATTTFPDATLDCDADGLRRVLPMLGTASQSEDLQDYLRAIADPAHIVHHGR